MHADKLSNNKGFFFYAITFENVYMVIKIINQFKVNVSIVFDLFHFLARNNDTCRTTWKL